MTNNNYLFTSESVSEGHPDKVCDRISDMVVDLYLSKNPESRVACETLTTTNKVVLAGETRGPKIDKDELINKIRNCIKEIGYDQKGFSWKTANIETFLHEQSSDIAMGVDSKDNKDEGAGDQGIMFGYASNENEAYLPAPIYYSHEILKTLEAKRRGGYEYLLPDAKSQVSVEYEGGVPKRIDQIVVSTQHTKGFNESLKMPVRDSVEEVLGNLIDKNTVWHINPTGNFEIGGPDGDTGLTGRKIIVDTYGGFAPHGGGAFSGKDPTKVDRSAAYMARWLAKNVVADNMADWCQIQLSYAIGIKEPTSIYVDSNGHNKSIQKFIEENIDLTPKGIIDRFDLFNFHQYSKNCIYGHFGDKNVPWEQIGWNYQSSNSDEPKTRLEQMAQLGSDVLSPE